MTKHGKGRFEFLDGFPRDVVAFEAKGHIEAEDYETILSPEIEARIREEGKVKLFYVLGPEFQGFSAGAAWQDTRLGLMHLADFARIAVVSDKDWVRTGTRMFAPLIPAEVGVFRLDDQATAKDWICRNEPDTEQSARVDADYKIPPLEDRMPPKG